MLPNKYKSFFLIRLFKGIIIKKNHTLVLFLNINTKSQKYDNNIVLIVLNNYFNNIFLIQIVKTILYYLSLLST